MDIKTEKNDKCEPWGRGAPWLRAGWIRQSPSAPPGTQ